ncbi:hypothetical protein PCE1_003861 [Barthelona sp. PCE]
MTWNNIRFNQDHSLLVGCTNAQVIIFQVFPLQKLISLDYKNVIFAELVYNSSLLVLVTGDSNNAESTHHIILYHIRNKTVLHKFSLDNEVKDIRANTTHLLVYSESQLIIFPFRSLPHGEIIVPIDPDSNPNLIHLSPNSTNNFVSYQKENCQLGELSLLNIGSRHTDTFKPHKNELMMSVFSHDGNRIATASEQGTLVRIFDSKSHDLLHTFRRGLSNSTIYGLSFSPDGSKVAAISESGKIHIFELFDDENIETSVARATYTAVLDEEVDSASAVVFSPSGAEIACLVRNKITVFRLLKGTNADVLLEQTLMIEATPQERSEEKSEAPSPSPELIELPTTNKPKVNHERKIVPEQTPLNTPTPLESSTGSEGSEPAVAFKPRHNNNRRKGGKKRNR